MASLPKLRQSYTYFATGRETLYGGKNQGIYPTTFPEDILHSWSDGAINNLSIFILSAVGLNHSTLNIPRYEVKLTGWVDGNKSIPTIKCCTLLYNGDSFSYYEPDIQIGNQGVVPLAITQISCPVNSSMDNVKGIAIQFSDQDCPQNGQLYVKPYVPKPPEKEHSFGICLKLLYGQNINIVNLKTWIEYYIELGVDKVFMYTYNISKTTKDVLNYYGKKGFLERRPYDYPLKTTR
ncbi:hypothetical protein ACF0H5_012687 [Mactra antiquata]